MRASTARCGLLWHAWTLVGEAEADNHCKVAVVSQRLSLNRLASIKAGCQLKYPVRMSMEQRPPDWFPFAPLCSTVLLVVHNLLSLPLWDGLLRHSGLWRNWSLGWELSGPFSLFWQATQQRFVGGTRWMLLTFLKMFYACAHCKYIDREAIVHQWWR